MAVLSWTDRVYGEVVIDDPGVLALIEGPTFRRLKGIRQAGPSALAFPFKTVTRHEHSLGVYLLLGRLGACHKERVAGLLHDISHTAFSHAVDFVFASEEQDHHEGLKPEFLHRADIAGPLESMGYRPEDFHDDSVYPLLEQPLPGLCADRLDYFFRDSLACGITDRSEVVRFLAHLRVVDRTIAFDDVSVAREVVARFAVMNRDWWASPTEAYIYNEFADALRDGFRSGALGRDDLLSDDAHVLARLQQAGGPAVLEKLDHVLRFQIEATEGFRPTVNPKVRWLDPAVLDGSKLRRVSELA